MAKLRVRTTGVGESTVPLPSWRLHLEAASLSPGDPRPTNDGALFAKFLAGSGMPALPQPARIQAVGG